MISRIALLGLAALLAGCPDSKKDLPPPPPPDVEVVAVEQRDVPIYRDWVGTLAGDVNATISAQVSGYMLRRAYEEGRTVNQGDVLFQIDPAPFEALLARATAQLDEAEAKKGKTEQDVARYTPLADVGAISKQELDDAIQADKSAAAQVASAQAEIKEAQLNLAFTTIRSPVDGVAGLAKAQIGDLVGPATGALTTVTAIDPIRVEFSVSQQLMTTIQERLLAEGKPLRTGEGPPLELLLASNSVYPHKGAVRFSDNQIDIKTGTIRVVGEFPNPQHMLVPGMFVRVRALLDTHRSALLVPQRAVTDLQGRYLIAVVGSDNKVSIKPVEAGERVDQLWVVSGDLKAGDRVVAEGVQKVRDGSVVNPVPFQGTAVTATMPSPGKSPEEKS